MENFDIFTLDLRLKPSRIFENEHVVNEDEEEDQGVENRQIKNDIEWHYKDGIAQNMSKLNKEFNEYR